MFGYAYGFLPIRLCDDETTDASSGGGSSSSSSDRWKNSKTAGALRAAGSSLSSSGQSEMNRSSNMSITPSQYKRGGKVRKTGMAKLHKNERVIPAGKRKKVERLMKKSEMRMKARS